MGEKIWAVGRIINDIIWMVFVCVAWLCIIVGFYCASFGKVEPSTDTNFLMAAGACVVLVDTTLKAKERNRELETRISRIEAELDLVAELDGEVIDVEATEVR